jgi:hypothetical protein
MGHADHGGFYNALEYRFVKDRAKEFLNCCGNRGMEREFSRGKALHWLLGDCG